METEVYLLICNWCDPVAFTNYDEMISSVNLSFSQIGGSIVIKDHCELYHNDKHIGGFQCISLMDSAQHL